MSGSHDCYCKGNYRCAQCRLLASPDFETFDTMRNMGSRKKKAKVKAAR